jgi:RluA family pseudouridine synthase
MRKDSIEIIYKDDDIIVINKPAGVSVTKDRSGEPQLEDFLGPQLGEEQTTRLRLVHRLDKDTSGAMILARNRAAQQLFAGYFENRQVKKTYLALVKAAVRTYEGVIDAPIGRDRKNPELMRINHRDGKESITQWRLLADFGLVSLLAVSPLTGRTHQIRVHLPSIGFRLAIDPMYGTSEPIMLSDFKRDYQLGNNQFEKPLIDRLTLHAYQIEIPYLAPGFTGGSNSIFVAPLDRKFAATIKMLTKYNADDFAAFLNMDDFSKIMDCQPL